MDCPQSLTFSLVHSTHPSFIVIYSSKDLCPSFVWQGQHKLSLHGLTPTPTFLFSSPVYLQDFGPQPNFSKSSGINFHLCLSPQHLSFSGSTNRRLCHGTCVFVRPSDINILLCLSPQHPLFCCDRANRHHCHGSTPPTASMFWFLDFQTSSIFIA